MTMKMFPFSIHSPIIAMSEDSARCVIRVRDVPRDMSRSEYRGTNINPDTVLKDEDFAKWVNTYFEKASLTYDRGPVNGDDDAMRWYCVAVDTKKLKDAKPAWFKDLIGIFTRMQRDEVIPDDEKLTPQELTQAKAMWSAAATASYAEKAPELAKQARIEAEKKAKNVSGVSTHGSHVLD